VLKTLTGTDGGTCSCFLGTLNSNRYKIAHLMCDDETVQPSICSMMLAAATVASSLLHCTSSTSNYSVKMISMRAIIRASEVVLLSTFLWKMTSLKDSIVDLPGLDYDPSFRQYSGYLTVMRSSFILLVY
jgi:hypothetical protein